MSNRLPLAAALALLAQLAASGRLGTSAPFALDLVRKAPAGLSGKQLDWVYRLLGRIEEPAAPAIGDVAPIVALLARARAAGLRYPKIRLAAGDGSRVVVSECGDRSKTPGDLRVTDGGTFHDGRYFGRITRAGAWIPGRDSSTPVLAVLVAMAADPAATAAAYGRQSGACCFCGRPLDDGRSVAVGYGPVCADKFGLPWGGTSAPPIAVTVDGPPQVTDPGHPAFGGTTDKVAA